MYKNKDVVHNAFLQKDEREKEREREREREGEREKQFTTHFGITVHQVKYSSDLLTLQT